MNILYLGDVVGRAGRQAITDELPGLRDRLNADFVVVNGENATSGMGLSGAHAKGILDAGANCITWAITHLTKKICFSLFSLSHEFCDP